MYIIIIRQEVFKLNYAKLLEKLKRHLTREAYHSTLEFFQQKNSIFTLDTSFISSLL